MSNFYTASDLTGNSPGCLDYIDPLNSDGLGTLLNAGDYCLVNSAVYGVLLYKLTNTGALSNPPVIIVPANNPGNFAWESLYPGRLESYIDGPITPGQSYTITHSEDPDNRRIVKAGLTKDSGATVLMLPDLFIYEIISSTQTKVTMLMNYGYEGSLITYIILG